MLMDRKPQRKFKRSLKITDLQNCLLPSQNSKRRKKLSNWKKKSRKLKREMKPLRNKKKWRMLALKSKLHLAGEQGLFKRLNL